MNIRITQDGKLLIEGVQIMNGPFRNFSGEKEGRYDQPGKRYFNLVVDDADIAQKMKTDHWPLKILAPKDELDKPKNIMKVSVRPENKYFPCHVRTFCGGVLTELDAEDYKNLDSAEIVSADLTLRLWEYDYGEYSAQLEEGIFTIQPLSYWEDKYAQEEHPWE